MPAMKFEIARIHFLSDVFVAAAVVTGWLTIKTNCVESEVAK